MKASPKMRDHLAAYRVKGHAIAQAQEAKRAVLSPGKSFWLCPPDKFYEEARKRAAQLNAVTTSYAKPWGMV